MACSQPPLQMPGWLDRGEASRGMIITIPHIWTAFSHTTNWLSTPPLVSATQKGHYPQWPDGGSERTRNLHKVAQQVSSDGRCHSASRIPHPVHMPFAFCLAYRSRPRASEPCPCQGAKGMGVQAGRDCERTTGSGMGRVLRANLTK